MLGIGEAELRVVLLVFLEVEFGDYEGFFGFVGEVDRSVCFRRRVEELVRVGGRFEVGGGVIV